MISQLAKVTPWVFALVAALLLTTGCASYWVRYDKGKTFVRQDGPQFNKDGKELEVGKIPCSGELDLVREHGLFWWPGGFYRDEEEYDIYFKTPSESSRDFYFKVSRHYYKSAEIADAQGVVVVTNRSVFIDVQYRDLAGKWRKPPINGIHKIDCVLPDDVGSPP
jgi:hypothetical protein